MKPEPIPFWEKESGDRPRPITKATAWQEELERRAEQRRRRYAAPHVVVTDSAGRPQ